MELNPRSDGSFHGFWIGEDRKSIPVELKSRSSLPAVEPSERYFAELKAKNVYELLRLADLRLQNSKREKFGGYTLQWKFEPGSKITFPFVEQGYSTQQREKINDVLRARLWDEVSNFYDCVGQGKLRSGGNYDQSVTVGLVNERVISFNIYTDYYCGGAYPDNGDSGITLDVRSGRELTLEDVLWVGKGRPVHFKAAEHAGSGSDFEVFSAYRERYLSHWLVKQMSLIAPASLKDQGCPLGEAQYWAFPSWYLTNEGIVIAPSFPHVMGACRDHWVIPYTAFRAHPGAVSGVASSTK